MADAQQDLWPDLAGLEPLRTPLTILKEQAVALARKTNGLLEGRVDTRNDAGAIVEFFYIVAPTLDDYKYELLRVKHDAWPYPLEMEVAPDSREYTAKAEPEFVEALKKILSSRETMRVIAALLAQVKA